MYAGVADRGQIDAVGGGDPNREALERRDGGWRGVGRQGDAVELTGEGVRSLEDDEIEVMQPLFDEAIEASDQAAD